VKPRPGKGVRAAPKIISIQKGRIVRAVITPTKGVKKERPCVVLTGLDPDAAAPSERRFLVVGVTSDGGDYDPANTKKYPPDEYIEIPHASDGSCETGLWLPSAAYVGFVDSFAEKLLQATEGYLKPHLLDALIKKLQAYLAKNPD
jgi:hypothetical protein